MLRIKFLFVFLHTASVNSFLLYVNDGHEDYLKNRLIIYVVMGDLPGRPKWTKDSEFAPLPHGQWNYME